MRFTTLSFFIFFIVVYLTYWSLRGRARLHLLLLSSIVFYAAWSPFFALHFVGIVFLNYLFIRKILREKSRFLMFIALGIDFANLFFFKYFYLFLKFLFDLTGESFFAMGNFNQWLENATGADSIILPLAISFYTFQIVAFVVDSYRGNVNEDPGFLEFFVFILFFPQLVAGPIMRHTDFLPQLKKIQPSEQHITSGIFLLTMGLIKKVVIADNIGQVIGAVYQSPSEFDWSSNLLASLGYGVRVYNDFSGYTDIARGLAFLLGLDLPANFQGPYLSRSLKELWRTWHITLSSWLRDYIFIPLGGSHSSRFRSSVNLVITFTLGGLWHGAAYTFIVWGFTQGLLLVVERYIIVFYKHFKKGNKIRNEAPSVLSRFTSPIIIIAQTTYAFAMFATGLVFFNAPDLSSALEMYSEMLTLAEGTINSHNEYIFYMLFLTFILNGIEKYGKRPSMGRPLLYSGLFLFAFFALILMGRFAPGGADFIYFQF